MLVRRERKRAGAAQPLVRARRRARAGHGRRGRAQRRGVGRVALVLVARGVLVRRGLRVRLDYVAFEVGRSLRAVEQDAHGAVFTNSVGHLLRIDPHGQLVGQDGLELRLLQAALGAGRADDRVHVVVDANAAIRWWWRRREATDNAELKCTMRRRNGQCRLHEQLTALVASAVYLPEPLLGLSGNQWSA